MPQQHGPFVQTLKGAEILVIQTSSKDLGFYLLDFLNKALQRNIKRFLSVWFFFSSATNSSNFDQIEDQQLVLKIISILNKVVG